MTRLQQILTGAYRDLAYWRSQTPTPPRGDRKPAAWHNTQCDRATRGEVACDVAKWIGKTQTAADRVSTSRAYKALAARGLANPVSIGNRSHKTSLLTLTPAGEDLARQLIGADTDAPPADATPAEMLTPPTAEPIPAEPKPTGDPRDAAIFAALAQAITPTAAMRTPIHPTPVPTPAPIADADEALLLLFLREPEQPPYTVAVDDKLPISRATIDHLAATGMLTVHEADGAVAVATTGKGVFRAIAIQRDKALSAESTTADAAGTSPAAA